MLMKKLCLIVILIGAISNVFSQGGPPDVIDINYTFSSVDDEFDYKSLTIDLNVPFRIKVGKGFFMNAFGFEQTTLDFKDNYPFETDQFDKYTDSIMDYSTAENSKKTGSFLVQSVQPLVPISNVLFRPMISTYQDLQA